MRRRGRRNRRSKKTLAFLFQDLLTPTLEVAEFAPNTSFANLPGFALGMANIVLSYEGEKSGFVADLVYGPRGTDAVLAQLIRMGNFFKYCKPTVCLL